MISISRPIVGRNFNLYKPEYFTQFYSTDGMDRPYVSDSGMGR